jgi:hypothetical protein
MERRNAKLARGGTIFETAAIYVVQAHLMVVVARLVLRTIAGSLPVLPVSNSSTISSGDRRREP